MKCYISNNEFGCNKNRLSVDTSLKTAEARSYRWWQYVTTDKANNVFFIGTNYSVTTSGHQRETRDMLETLGYHIAWEFGYLYSSVHFRDTDIHTVCNKEIEGMRKTIRNLIIAIHTKGTRKVKNAERRNSIKELWYRIKDMRRIRDVYLDKVPVPYKTTKLIPLDRIAGYEFDPADKYDRKQSVKNTAAIASWSTYFKKPNGKLREADLCHFLNHKLKRYYNSIPNAPTSIDKIKQVLGVKGNDDILFILKHAHVQDVENMLPNIDTKEWVQLQKWLKRIGDHPKNLLLMEKLHAYLTNKQNRKDYVPSEPKRFPVKQELLFLSNSNIGKHLSIITTDQELKAEGRRQGHCIGGKRYIDDCRDGYQALNYKGYTFFLDPRLNIVQTNGRHNSQTPMEVKQELIRAIESVSNNTERKIS